MIINRRVNDFRTYNHAQMCVLTPNMTTDFKSSSDMFRQWVTEREIEIQDEIWEWCNQYTPGWNMCSSNTSTWDGPGGTYQLVMQFTNSEHAMMFKMSWY